MTKAQGEHMVAPVESKKKCQAEHAIVEVFLLVQTLVSWQIPLTRQYSRDFSESGIRAFQCCDCPTAQCGSRHDM